MVKSLFIICALLFICESAFAQKTTELERRERELHRLRTEIAAFEKKVADSERRERSTLERLDDLEQQSDLLRQLIRRLREEEKQLTRDISEARSSIGDLERQVQSLTTHYAGWVRSLYMNGRVYDLELLFSSRSLNQLSIRLQYLRRFSDQRAQDLNEIVTKKTTLEKQNNDLQSKLSNERRVLSEKTREENKLKRTYGERQSVLKKVRKDKKAYTQELSKRTTAVRQIGRAHV